MPKRKRPKSLKIITISIPIPFLRIIQKMRQERLTPSVSEYIRKCIWKGLKDDLNLVTTILDNKEEFIKVVEEFNVTEYKDYFVICEKVWQKQ